MNIQINLWDVWRPYDDALRAIVESLTVQDVAEIATLCSAELSEMFDEDELEMM